MMIGTRYRHSGRVYWVVDNASIHRGRSARRRKRRWYPYARIVPTSMGGVWLNQVEIYFSLVRRAEPTLNRFESLGALGKALRSYQEVFNDGGQPFR